MRRLAVIIPVYNEAQSVELFWDELRPALVELSTRVESTVFWVDNGSTDGTSELLTKLAADWPEAVVVRLTRNFGYQGALQAGLHAARGDLFCFVDADGEDPPELLAEFLDAIDEGVDLAYGIRRTRQEAASVSRLRRLFYRIVHLVADDPFYRDVAEFGMFTAPVREAVLQSRSSYPFLRSSLARVGFPAHGIAYAREKRLGGTSHFSWTAMVTFAVGGFLSSTTWPLRFALYTAPLVLAASTTLFIIGAMNDSTVVLTSAVFTMNAYLVVVAAFIAIYVARTYKNSLGVPNFVIDRARSAGLDAPDPEGGHE